MEVGGVFSFVPPAAGREGALLLFVGGGNRSEHTISSLSRVYHSLSSHVYPLHSSLEGRGRLTNKCERANDGRGVSENLLRPYWDLIFVAKTSCLPLTLVLIFYHRRCTLYICIASHLMMFPIKATLNYSPPFDATSYIHKARVHKFERESKCFSATKPAGARPFESSETRRAHRYDRKDGP